MPRPPRQTNRRRHTRRRRDPTYRGKRIDRASCLRLAREIPEPKYPAFRRSVRTQLPATGYPYKPRPADTPVDVTNELFDLIDDARASSSSRSPRGRSTRRRRPRGPKRTWRRTAKKVAKYVLFGALLAFSLKTTWGVQQELEKVKGEMATLKRGVAAVGGPVAGVGAVAVGVVGAGSGAKGGKMDDDIRAILTRAQAFDSNIMFVIKKSSCEEVVSYAPKSDKSGVEGFWTMYDSGAPYKKEFTNRLPDTLYKVVEQKPTDKVPCEFQLNVFTNRHAPSAFKTKTIRIKEDGRGNVVSTTNIGTHPDAILRVITVKMGKYNPVPPYIELYGENGEWEIVQVWSKDWEKREKQYKSNHSFF